MTARLKSTGAVRRTLGRVVLLVLAYFVLFTGVIVFGSAYNPEAALTLALLGPPVALLALLFGRWAGLAAAAGATLIPLGWDLIGGDTGSSGNYAWPAVVYFALGFGLGSFADPVTPTAVRMATALDAMLDSVTFATPVRDAAGQIVDLRISYTNAAAVAVIEQGHQNLVGRCWSEIWPEAFRSDLLAAFAQTVETGTPTELVDYGLILASPDGPLHLVVDLRATRLGGGLLIAWREVSARRRDAQQVAAATAQFTAAFDHAPVGMALVAPDRMILRANKAFGAISGHQPEAVVGTSFEALIDPRDVAKGHADFDRLISGDEPNYHRERRVLTLDGHVRWVSIRVARIEGADGVYAVAHVEDIQERKNYEGRLRFLADHDPLTGLFNRRRFHEELAHQLALDTRYNGTSAVVLVDLDNFKYINDTLGHQTGDRLVQVIARSLQSRLRGSDVIGRLGGDEFAVLLPGADQARAASVTGSLLAGIRGSEVGHAGQRVRSTGSAGIAVGIREGADADTALANADLAMYAAKDAGRNTYVLYDPQGPHAERSRSRFRWIDRVRHALEDDLFTLHAQPILELASGSITGSELLLRMREDGGLICPDRFLPIAERHGFANPIDRFVITRAIEIAAAQRRPPPFRWEINLSADSLGDPGTFEVIEAELNRTGLPAASLVFEITETAAISNLDQAQAFAARITEIGSQFALDDFGAGYGSFYYLKHLPFEYLKIDGEFIRELTTSRIDRIIVQAIVTAARRLGKQTIAEYVGDAETLELLRELHVDHAQGYHIGHPIDPGLMAASPTS